MGEMATLSQCVTACKNQDDMRTEGPYGLNYNANNATTFWRSQLRLRGKDQISCNSLK